MSSPERAVPQIPDPSAENEPAWPLGRDSQFRKPPQRSFNGHTDGNLIRNEDAKSDRFGRDEEPLGDGNIGASRSANSANEDFSLRNGPSDPTSKVFNFPLRERLMNAREVADRLGVSERWVRDHTTRRSPKIRAVKLGTLIRYRPADVDSFMDHLDTLRPSSHTRFGV